MELLTFVMVSFCSPSGLSEALLPISGCDFRRETVCVARCQAVMVKYVRLKRTQFHMRIWLYHGWCSRLFNLSESLLDSRKTEILSGFSVCITPQLQERSYCALISWGTWPDVGHLCDAPVGVICAIKMSLIVEDWWQLCLVCDSSQWYVDVLELNTIILQNI